ncbi:putative methylesterase 14, chloroplastic isoform X2 [Dioscorea cayenensis subsp. rotundata]|uniref:Methylesterase 14, chloroplastic isoform X2 n=1 Tax=Dioscorea cayennensis subsp. rotundata TaxID=55577 RepID=A0AB40C3F5_DIOCR|nr:putative methylesterase 14, chloroplastic isoform X2 [Dioscorea cayenensis subsp. rotundata]
MGNAMDCMSRKDSRPSSVSRSKRNSKSQRKTSATAEDEQLHRQALAMAIQQHQLSQRFEGSMSRRITGSTSSRRLADPFSNGKQQAPIVLDNVETKKLVLVHGEGFGAWCWYKTITMLEEAGLEPIALDLTGSGIDTTDTNIITSLEDYAKPLINYLHNLPEGEKVILVGHSCGGASISYALECYPKKISKAVFVCATMVADGQKPFDIFAEEDIALATVAMRPTPLAPIMEKLSLSPGNYGSVRRYFVQTLDDRMLSPDVQEKLVRENPPHGVYKIKGSDHCPFFSKPLSLNKILLEIIQL